MYIVYGKPNCTYCDQAKRLLKIKEEQFAYVDVSQDAEAMQKMRDMGARTVPQIFFGDEHIGGFTELKENLMG